jgi:hypothetical protein
MRSGRKTEICWRLDVPGWKAVLVAALKPGHKDDPVQEMKYTRRTRAKFLPPK